METKLIRDPPDVLTFRSEPVKQMIVHHEQRIMTQEQSPRRVHLPGPPAAPSETPHEFSVSTKNPHTMFECIEDVDVAGGIGLQRPDI